MILQRCQQINVASIQSLSKIINSAGLLFKPPFICDFELIACITSEQNAKPTRKRWTATSLGTQSMMSRWKTIS